MTRTKLTLSHRSLLRSVLPRTMTGAILLLSLHSGCDLPADTEELTAPDSPLELLAQGARIPQLNKIEPATVFSGAAQMLTLTGRNFTPDLKVYVDGTALTISRLVSTTQVQVLLPSTVNAIGKRVVRVENGSTYRGSDRNDLLSIVADPIALATLEQPLDGDPGKQVLSADVNGDGKADVLVLSPDTSTVRIHVSQGRGKPIAQSLRVGSSAVSFTTGDVNADGKLDIVVVSSSTVSSYLGDGTGAFTFGKSSIESRFASIPNLPSIVTLADVTDDGKVDLCFGANQVVIGTGTGTLACAAGKGDGSFSASTTIKTNLDPVLQVRADDVTGDGKADLLVATGGEVPIIGGKTGALTVIPMPAAMPTASYSWTSADKVTAITSGDYNRDGKNDVAVVSADARLNIFYGTGDGKFPSSRSMAASTPGSQLFSADWNKDGKLDIVMGGRSESTSVLWAGSLFVGNGDGSFANSVYLKPTRLEFSNIAVGDVDADGKPDLAGIDDKTGKPILYFGRGDVSLVSSPDGGTFLRDYVASGDFNGDGIIDLVSASVISNVVSVTLGLGDGQFKTLGSSANVDKGPSAIATGDFNGDGKIDVVASNYDSAVVSLLLGNGDGTLAAQRTFSVGKAPSGIAVMDVNADGQLDIVTSNAEADNVSVLIGNGTGNFATSKEYPVGKYPIAVVLADFSGDGRPDIVTANADSNNLSYLQGSAASAGVFNLAKSIAACASPASLTATDLNGDSKLDLLVACADDAGIAYFIGKGDGTFNAAKTLQTCSFPSDVQVAQLTDDTKADLVVACGSPKTLQFYPQVADLTFSPSPRTVDLGRGFFVGDLTGDRKADVLVTESPTTPLLLINTNR